MQSFVKIKPSRKCQNLQYLGIFAFDCFPWECVYYCGCDITPCNKIDKPLVVYRFSGNVMTSIITLRKRWPNFDIFTPKMRFLSNFNAM